MCATNPFTASASLAEFFDGLRATGTPLRGNNAQLAQLLLSGLELLSSDSTAANDDAMTLQMDLEVIVEALTADGSDAEYPDDPEEDEEEEQGDEA